MRNLITTISFLVVISIIYSAAAQSVTVTAEDCARLVEHNPDSDVAYRPGVDVAGKAVAPADLGGGLKIEPPKEFSIPITVDLQKKLGLPVDPNQYQTQNFAVGVVTFRDGRAWFNGQPLQDDEAYALSRLCQRQVRAGR